MTGYVVQFLPVIGCELTPPQVGGRNDSTAFVLTVSDRARHLEDAEHPAVPETHKLLNVSLVHQQKIYRQLFSYFTEALESSKNESGSSFFVFYDNKLNMFVFRLLLGQNMTQQDIYSWEYISLFSLIDDQK